MVRDWGSRSRKSICDLSDDRAQESFGLLTVFLSLWAVAPDTVLVAMIARTAAWLPLPCELPALPAEQAACGVAERVRGQSRGFQEHRGVVCRGRHALTRHRHLLAVALAGAEQGAAERRRHRPLQPLALAKLSFYRVKCCHHSLAPPRGRASMARLWWPLLNKNFCRASRETGATPRRLSVGRHPASSTLLLG